MRYYQVRSQCAANMSSISISKNTARHKSNTIQHIPNWQSAFSPWPSVVLGPRWWRWRDALFSSRSWPSCWTCGTHDGGGVLLCRDHDEHAGRQCDNDCVLVNLLLEVRSGLGNLTSAVVAHSHSLRIVNWNNISYLLVGHLFSSSYVAFFPLGLCFLLYVLFVILLPKSFHCIFAAKIDRAQLRNFNLPPLHIPQPYQELPPPHTIHSPIFPFTISQTHLEIGRIPAVGWIVLAEAQWIWEMERYLLYKTQHYCIL